MKYLETNYLFFLTQALLQYQEKIVVLENYDHFSYFVIYDGNYFAEN